MRFAKDQEVKHNTSKLFKIPNLSAAILIAVNKSQLPWPSVTTNTLIARWCTRPSLSALARGHPSMIAVAFGQRVHNIRFCLSQSAMSLHGLANKVNKTICAALDT